MRKWKGLRGVAVSFIEGGSWYVLLRYGGQKGWVGRDKMVNVGERIEWERREEEGMYAYAIDNLP